MKNSIRNGIPLEIQELLSLSILRQYLSSLFGTYKLHLFSDVTDHVMGACLYFRNVNGNICESALVVGISCLFPQIRVSRFSIARNELLALCMQADVLKQYQA